VPKDRAALFSRKHRRYWITVTGGMVLIGVINITIGLLSYTPPPETHERIHLTLPQAYTDAGVDATPTTTATTPR
jgi:hypothetical protein